MDIDHFQVSSVEIERVCNEVDEDVLETAAIGVAPPVGGPDQLVVVVVFKEKNWSEEALTRIRTAFNSSIQKKLNPLFRVSLSLSITYTCSVPQSLSLPLSL